MPNRVRVPGYLDLGARHGFALVYAGATHRISLAEVDAVRKELAPPYDHMAPEALAVLVQALVFGRLHSYTDSPVYAVAATVAGLVFGGAFALTQNLWVPIVTPVVVGLVSFLVWHVQVAALDEAEQLALVETDVPIATALRLTLGPRPAAPAKPTAGELPAEP
jgi:hypothetical protein